MGARLEQPIIIVGTHRSGTSFLGKVFDRHPDIAYWEEPRHVWVRGNAKKADDVLVAADATPKISARIHETFDAHRREHGGSRFAEKTPSNCLRLDFIEAVFPDARYIHIYRDGRAVVSSMLRMLHTGSPEARRVLERLRGTPITEWPSLVSRGMTTIGSKLTGKGMQFWGPRPTGWREWLDEDEVVRVAKQWRYTLEPVLEFRERVDKSRWAEIAYEEMMRDPVARVKELFAAAGVEHDDGTLGWVAERADPTRQEKWRTGLSDEQLERMRPVIGGTIEGLGYEW